MIAKEVGLELRTTETALGWELHTMMTERLVDLERHMRMMVEMAHLKELHTTTMVPSTLQIRYLHFLSMELRTTNLMS